MDAILRLTADIDDHDGMRAVTYLTVGGLAAAMGLAVIGGFPLDTPMPTHVFGWVTPTCGLTRGSTAIVRGDFAIAWRYNPLSFLVMAFGLFGVGRAAVGVFTRRWFNLRIRFGPQAWALAAVAFVALGMYQQSNADFIIHSRI